MSSIRNNNNALTDNDSSAHMTLTDPKDEDSTSTQSFDEDDMFGSDNSDYIVCPLSDSHNDAQISLVRMVSILLD
jgi:hypothetical protein